MGGTMVQSFLNVNDYHRQHAPASGTIIEAGFIPGHVYMDVSLDRVKIKDKEPVDAADGCQTDPHLEAHDPTGFQFRQCRGLFVLQTPIGKIAVLPVGMAQVSSVVFVRPGSEELMRLSAEEQKILSYEEQVNLINARIQRDIVGRTVKKVDMITSMVLDGDRDEGTASVADGAPLEEVCFGHRQVLAAPGKPRPAARASALPPALTTATPPHWHARTSPTFPA